MLRITDNVRLDLNKCVPSSTINEISCFSFYDNHPRDGTKLDIVVCSTTGEFKEYFQRELVLSIFIESLANEIRLLRNNNGELFYLVVAAQGELIVLSRKDKLTELHRFTNIEKYDVEDLACSGQVHLRVFKKDDAVPLIFDENFENISDHTLTQCYKESDDSLPVVRQLMRKLTEAKYTVQSNNKVYKDLLKLRQQASFTAYHTPKPLVLKSTTPLVKLCNGKIIIVLEFLQCKLPIQDITILLHGTTRPSVVYTTKVYERITTEPFWRENTLQNLNQGAVIVCTVDLNELKYNISSRVELTGVISYKVNREEQFLPFQNISISALDTSCEFDVLSKTLADIDENQHVILSIMATTQKIELCLRHIKNKGDPHLNVMNLFCKHLEMERFRNTNMIVHKKTPFHTLHGVMLMLEEKELGSGYWNLSVYTRNPSQILALLNYVHDAIPYKIIITTTGQRISPKNCQTDEYNEDLSHTKEINTNYTDYASSILNQSSSMLNYLDCCMMKMSESKNPSVLNKVGSHIDPYAGGIEQFNEFRKKILMEAAKGISTLKKSYESTQEDEGMIIESD